MQRPINPPQEEPATMSVTQVFNEADRTLLRLVQVAEKSARRPLAQGNATLPPEFWLRATQTIARQPGLIVDDSNLFQHDVSQDQARQ
jgi:hypothetical protein